jgi:hypothetical protein
MLRQPISRKLSEYAKQVGITYTTAYHPLFARPLDVFWRIEGGEAKSEA